MSKRFVGASRLLVLSILLVMCTAVTGCFCCDPYYYEDCGEGYHHYGGGRGHCDY